MIIGSTTLWGSVDALGSKVLFPYLELETYTFRPHIITYKILILYFSLDHGVIVAAPMQKFMICQTIQKLYL